MSMTPQRAPRASARTFAAAALAASFGFAPLLLAPVHAAEELRLLEAPAVVDVPVGGKVRSTLRFAGPAPEEVVVIDELGDRLEAWSVAVDDRLDIGWTTEVVPARVSLELRAGDQVVHWPLRLRRAPTGHALELSADDRVSMPVSEAEDAELDAAVRNLRSLERPPIDPAHGTAIVGIRLGEPPSEGRVDWSPHPEADDTLGVETASSAPPPRYESFGLDRSLPSLNADERLELDALGAWLAEAELGAAARRRWRQELRAISGRTGLDEASLAQASLARAASTLEQSRERRLGQIHSDEQLLEAVHSERRRAGDAWDLWQVPGERAFVPDRSLAGLSDAPLPERIGSRRDLRAYLRALEAMEAAAESRVRSSRQDLSRLERAHRDRLSELEALNG